LHYFTSYFIITRVHFTAVGTRFLLINLPGNALFVYCIWSLLFPSTKEILSVTDRNYLLKAQMMTGISLISELFIFTNAVSSVDGILLDILFTVLQTTSDWLRYYLFIVVFLLGFSGNVEDLELFLVSFVYFEKSEYLI
jgi:hypothetical protein